MPAHFKLNRKIIFACVLVFCSRLAMGQQLISAGQPAQLDIRIAGENSVRVTLKPINFKADFPSTPALADQKYALPVISIRSLNSLVKKRVGNLWVEIKGNPLTVTITNIQGHLVQQVVFQEDGNVSFQIADKPIIGMGEGGPKTAKGENWRDKSIEFDRRGRLFDMQPRWQSDAYGTRNPVPLLIGTEGWGLFVASPWVQVDLRDKHTGIFIPWKPGAKDSIAQTEKNQGLANGKGKPPLSAMAAGVFDLFIFDAHDPAAMMKDLSLISGRAVMPPKWAMGYMQSHRTLEDEKQMISIVDTFRAKKIPVDAVIYLGTGFVSRGWNTMQPSFDSNPEVFKQPIKDFVSDMHHRNTKVILHMVPYDRDQLPTLHGSIPAAFGEHLDNGHILSYWQKHVPLMNAGVDAFWPDEGDWFNLYERIKRHQLYYQGPLSTRPNVRPWSLHRNGFLGIAKWGGWVWSGDTESSWKTLEGQIAVGINHSLSLSPFWGSDIGGFYSTEETTGELYTRWFQFAAFTPSFRSHGRTWFTRLPWGWGLKQIGPRESGAYPLDSTINKPQYEPVIKKYDELRYQLLSYNYTLAWQARNAGLPLMRAMWLQYPQDVHAAGLSTQYMWGDKMLVAPVFTKGAVSRDVYLPKGKWYDWWSNDLTSGGKAITRKVDLNIIPIFIKTGAIIPFDPIRQYTAEKVNEPLILKVYPGANGSYTLYEDDGISLNYLKGGYTLTNITWNDKLKQLTIKPGNERRVVPRKFKVMLMAGSESRIIKYAGRTVKVKF